MYNRDELDLDPNDPGHQALAQALTSTGWRAQVETELAGGASTRRFFRLQVGEAPTAGLPPTAVAMYVPAPSQEIAKARQSAGDASFIEVRNLLASHSVRVPEVYARAPEHDILFVEDLGDSTLASYLHERPEVKTALYETAVSDLARAQSALEPLPEDSVIRTRAFDRDLLRWEVEHFRDWALDAQGLSLSAEDSAIFDRAAEHLASTIASWPRGFVHRDYQSRNLMVREVDDGHTLTWIDFQDAMLGPRVYDLVALLTDSYQTFDRSFIEARLSDYCRQRGIEDERQRVGYEFDFVTVQRKLKDAGRFVFIDRVNGNPAFLRYVDSTIGRARSALKRLRDDPVLAELGAMLDRVLPN